MFRSHPNTESAENVEEPVDDKQNEGKGNRIDRKPEKLERCVCLRNSSEKMRLEYHASKPSREDHRPSNKTHATQRELSLAYLPGLLSVP